MTEPTEQPQGQDQGFNPVEGPPPGTPPEQVEWFEKARDHFGRLQEQHNAFKGYDPEVFRGRDPELVHNQVQWFDTVQEDPDVYYSLGDDLAYLEPEEIEETTEEYEPSGELADLREQFGQLSEQQADIQAEQLTRDAVDELTEALDALDDQVGGLSDEELTILTDRAQHLLNDGTKLDVDELVAQAYDQSQELIQGLLGAEANARSGQPVASPSGGFAPDTTTPINSPEQRKAFIRDSMRTAYGR